MKRDIYFVGIVRNIKLRIIKDFKKKGYKWSKMFQLQPNIPTTQKVLDEPSTKHYKKFYKGRLQNDTKNSCLPFRNGSITVKNAFLR